MATYQYLTREQELAYGRQVQAMLKVKKDAEGDGIDLEKLQQGPVNKIKDPELRKIRTILDDGNRAAEALIEANTGLVIDRAKRFKEAYPSAPDLEDIIQDGKAGLVRAVWKYDPSRGLKFSTMAVPWIFQSISRSANQVSRPIRLPENRVDQLSKIMRMRKDYADTGMRMKEIDQEIMQKLGLSKEVFDSIVHASVPLVSLNVEIRDGDTHKELGDLINLGQEPSVEERFEQAAMSRELTSAILSLGDMNADIIAAAFGIHLPGRVLMRPKDAKTKWHISNKTYAMRLKAAVEALRQALSSKGLTYLDLAAVAQ